MTAGDTGTGGADCSPGPDETVVLLDPPVDVGPAGVELPGVETDRVDCERLPDLPVTRCTTPGER